VLLAEHEPEVAEMSARYLCRDGMAVRLVTTPEQALAELTAGPGGVPGPDLTVLDLTMPGLDPRRIRRALRTPVIFVVAGPQGPRPRGLARGPAGPRRWLVRPFGPRQLVAVAREVLAAAPRAAGDEDQPAERVAGALRLTHPGLTGFAGPGRCVMAHGQPVRLTATEFAVLAALLEYPGRVLSRRQLLAAAGRPAAGDRAADVYVAQLRAKLRAVGAAGAVRTVRAAGYVVDP
jgi:DNA-binding response OmpR family regulator